VELKTTQQAETHLQANPSLQSHSSGLIWTVLAWVLTIFLALAFTAAGGVKLVNNPGMVQEFAQIGLGQWFRYFTGILEVSGAIGLLIPGVRFWAALQIATVMVGATIANIAVLHLPALARLTAVLLVLALALAWLRRPQPGPKPLLAT
jgi:putative oxidoreductase